MSNIQTSADTIAEKAASAAQWGGSGTAVVTGGAHVFGLTTDEWTALAAIIGALVAVAGYFTGLYFKQQYLKLARSRPNAPLIIE